jgi:hypothetical protein
VPCGDGNTYYQIGTGEMGEASLEGDITVAGCVMVMRNVVRGNLSGTGQFFMQKLCFHICNYLLYPDKGKGCFLQ